MSKEVEVVNGAEMLCEAASSEFNKFMDETVEDTQRAFQNFMTCAKTLMDIQRSDAENENEVVSREQEKELKSRQIDLEERKLKMEERSQEIELARIKQDAEIEKNRKHDSKVKNILTGASIGVTVLGIIVGCAMTNKTLDVNMESVIRDKDAFNSSKKLLDFFCLSRK